jgi:hypothetical protein
MSNHFFEYIKDSSTIILKEYQGLFGIPDYILFDPKNEDDYSIISIELKLKNWKRAIVQAFRYLNFSNKSFVVLDEKYVNPAIENISLFKHYNIGLASFNLNCEFKIYFNPTQIRPFSQQSTDKLIHSISTTKVRKKKYHKSASSLLFDSTPNI